MLLTEQELQRYNRQLILPDFGEEAQAKLKAAKVLVVGMGGLGNPRCYVPKQPCIVLTPMCACKYTITG